jgi:hypothetical protein
MNATNILCAGLLAGALVACQSPTPDNELQGRDSMWASDAIRSASLNQAILVQHTLYPYHFETAAADLNELGMRDLLVLAAHYKTHAGELNVRRGDASQALYEARVAKVQERLAQAGVAAGKVSIQDGLPGGDGMSSERVIVILKEKMSEGGVDTQGGISGGSNGSSSSSSSSSTPR